MLPFCIGRTWFKLAVISSNQFVPVVVLTATDSGYCSDQATLRVLYGRSGKGFPVREVNSSPTATFVW